MLYGFDIGGTKTEIAVYDEGLKLRFNKRIPTVTDDLERLIQNLHRLIDEASQSVKAPSGIGIGIPGVIRADDESLICANVLCLDGQTLQPILEEQFKLPVRIENDANCFVLSEAIGGAGQDYKNLFGAILGTGVGGALCIDKTLYQGANNLAGEWGHTPLPWSFHRLTQDKVPVVKCGCGLTGCLDNYLSGRGLSFIDKHLNGTSRNAEELLVEARKNRPDAIQSLNCYLELLACALGAIINILDPDAIVIGGGLSNAPELYQKLPALIAKYCLPINKPPAILKARFGDSGGVRGAALLHYSQATG
ncbi:ROK family protein [Dongshaea marina]|uniref:ROK family protein n=1 Tax=Dongshaea marina TaxID=2047966 RepID=UPI000D3E0CAC|nr:ROK family protein [Dongshaea marina]